MQERNKPCICGSGIKYKKCCGSGKYLFHFTSVWHLPKIFESGYLKLVTSNLKRGNLTEKELHNLLRKQGTESGMKEYNKESIKQFGKGVVWLTDCHEVNGHCLKGSVADKTEVCFVLPNTGYNKWKEWSRKQEDFDVDYVSILENGFNSNSWYVSEKEILLSDVLKCYNIKTGEIYM